MARFAEPVFRVLIGSEKKLDLIVRRMEQREMQRGRLRSKGSRLDGGPAFEQQLHHLQVDIRATRRHAHVGVAEGVSLEQLHVGMQRLVARHVFPQRLGSRLHQPSHRGEVQRRPPAFVRLLDGAWHLEQHAHALHVAEEGGEVQRRVAQLRLRQRVAARLQDRLHRLHIPRGARVVQRREALGRDRLERRAGGDEGAHHLAPLGRVLRRLGLSAARERERAPPVVVGSGEVGAVGDEQLHNSRVPLTRGGEHERAAVVVAQPQQWGVRRDRGEDLRQRVH
mmetsp:Transcript_34509/g.83950  ORF Transcript_34509/g.83950 Transcript_34509/m.83950 type:complete len:281 (-) Transcript_34509:13-855(-)